MKETVLTNAELGEYAYNSTYDTMEYTWTDTCHWANRGYSNVSVGCDNTNSYATSKIKEMLETRYLPTIGSNNLKEVDGYKIRLITKEELIGNLGYDENHKSAGDYIVTENVPTWVYRDFFDQGSNARGYWTMTPNSNSSASMLFVSLTGQVYTSYSVLGTTNSGDGVRPVINLLKSAID